METPSSSYDQNVIESNHSNDNYAHRVKKVIIFGASGMIGSGIVNQCLLDQDVQEITTIVRKSNYQNNEQIPKKLKEVVHDDFVNYQQIDLKDFNACFWALGVSSTQVDHQTFNKITKEYTMAAANRLAELNPNMSFVYISAAGTDHKSSSYWAKVKAETESELFKLPLNAASFRIALTESTHGEKTKVPLHRAMYFVLKPFMPIMSTLFPGSFSTTEKIGKAAINFAKYGYPKKILEIPDINSLAENQQPSTSSASKSL